MTIDISLQYQRTEQRRALMSQINFGHELHCESKLKLVPHAFPFSKGKARRMKLAKPEEKSLQGEHVHQGSSHLFFHHDETKTFWQVFSYLSTEALFLKIFSLEFSILYNNSSFGIISRPPRPAHMRHPGKNFDFFCPIIKNLHNSCQ